MHYRSIHALVAAFGLLLAAPSHAQSTAAAARPDPLNPRALVPPAKHVSALSSYRAAAEAKVGSWQEANATVTRIGGWRAYAREADSAPAAPAASGSATGDQRPPAVQPRLHDHGKP